MEVLKLVARGMNNRDIAKELFISENTVKNHVRNILEKLQIHSRMEAVMIAVREKLIELRCARRSARARKPRAGSSEGRAPRVEHARAGRVSRPWAGVARPGAPPAPRT